MQKFMSIPRLETLLADRYQIIQSLSNQNVGKTYIARDTQQLGHPKCVIKQLQLTKNPQSCLKSAQRLFAIEAEMLKKLGIHDRIPKLLHSFTEANCLYVVQEFIVGETLTDLLPVGKRYTQPWSEPECLQFLQEMLEILEFVHQQGIVHCNIAPEKIIRREADGKFVLLDCTAVQAISQPYVTKRGEFLITLPMGTFGYLPPEQLTGNPHPNSDLYALGLIGIQALTGRHPAQLEVDPTTGDLQWERELLAPVSEGLQALLSQMVKYHWKNRYPSTAAAIAALQSLQGSDAQVTRGKNSPVQSAQCTATSEENSKVLQITGEERTGEDCNASIPTPTPLSRCEFEGGVLEPSHAGVETSGPAKVNLDLELKGMSSTADTNTMVPDDSELSSVPTGKANSSQNSTRPMPSVLLLGMWTGITVNSLVITGGLTSLLHFSPSDEGPEKLRQATEQFHAGDYESAIAAVESIPTFSAAYSDAQTLSRRWQKDWEKAAEKFPLVEQAYQQERWTEAIAIASEIPEIEFWQNKIAPLVESATEKVAPLTPGWLETGYEKARERDFEAALEYLTKIPPGTPAYEAAQAKIPEYREKRAIKLEAEAHELVKRAYAKAIAKDFDGAIELLLMVPKDTPTYNKVQEKIREYKEKRRIKGNKLLQQAYERARGQDFAGAIRFLKQIPKGTPAYAMSQVKQVEYGKKLRVGRKRAAAMGVSESPIAVSPLTLSSWVTEGMEAGDRGTRVALESQISGIVEELEPGDFFQEVTLEMFLV